MGSSILLPPDTYPGFDELHIRHSVKKAAAYLAVYTLIDRETKQFILFSPSLEITGYGETEEKAKEMFRASMDHMFEYLMNLPLKKCIEELTKLGWKNTKFKRKDFTKSVADINEQAQIFNADIKNVQHMNIAA